MRQRAVFSALAEKVLVGEEVIIAREGKTGLKLTT